MGEDEKKDYRLHLINTIDNAIDNGISVYDLDVVNKKALRHNYISKQVVVDKIEKLKNQISIDICIENNLEKHNELKYKIDVLQELLEGEK